LSFVSLKAEKDHYVGCYLDDGHRLLKHRGKALKDNSIESCRKHCTGFKFIGLQVFIVYIFLVSVTIPDLSGGEGGGHSRWEVVMI
jgi:hypothetical protein